MKITLMQAKQAESALSKIVNQDVLEIHIAYRFSKLTRALAAELGTLEEQRVALVKKVGTESEGGDFNVPDDKMPDFLEQYSALMKEEIEVPFKKVKLRELTLLKLSPNELITLEPFFIEPVEDFEDAEVSEEPENNTEE